MADIAVEHERWLQFEGGKAAPLSFGRTEAIPRPATIDQADEDAVMAAALTLEAERASQIARAREAEAGNIAAGSASEDAAQEEEKQEDLKRPFVRNEQRALLGTALITAETILGSVVAGATWMAWRSLEFWRTITKSKNPFLKSITVKMNLIEKSTFAMGFLLLAFLFFVVLPSIAFVMWAAFNPLDAYTSFPEMRPMFRALMPNFLPEIET
ncbi:hypothetical protein HYW18_01210 [Candidatus Uhrbacteria bacterium]|nr:hypothetical protein [Candidatus Uhrbacteria bacterium]